MFGSFRNVFWEEVTFMQRCERGVGFPDCLGEGMGDKSVGSGCFLTERIAYVKILKGGRRNYKVS